MSQDVFRVDTSERDTTRRYEILKGAKWDIDAAQKLWFWVNHGMTLKQMMDMVPPVVAGITPEVDDEKFAGTGVRSP
jgi:hypothetical protein